MRCISIMNILAGSHVHVGRQVLRMMLMCDCMMHARIVSNLNDRLMHQRPARQLRDGSISLCRQRQHK